MNRCIKCYSMLALLIANNSINRSLLGTTENNSLARAFTKQQREVGMAARCGMLIREQWDGPVTSEYCDEMGWNALIALHALAGFSPIIPIIIALGQLNGQPLLLLSLFSLLSLFRLFSLFGLFSLFSLFSFSLFSLMGPINGKWNLLMGNGSINGY